MQKRQLIMLGRFGFALLTITAIIVQLMHLESLGVLNKVNFFSYFTNLSNIFASIIFLIGGYHLIKKHKPAVNYDVVRGTSVVCMALVGIVYVMLLSSEDLGHLLPWVNIVLHYVMPVVAVIDWFFDPPKNLKLKHIKYWMIFPLIYLSYTLTRGALVDWYPYPFLNPAQTGGYGAVAFYCSSIFLVFLVFGWVLVTLANKFKR